MKIMVKTIFLKHKLFNAVLLAFVLFASVSCSSKEEELKSAGAKYILSNINNPSSAEFITYVNSKNTKAALEEMGVNFESKHDVVVIEVEATNALGGRITKSYAVFFINKVPVEMIDADKLNPSNVQQAFSHLKATKGW